MEAVRTAQRQTANSVADSVAEITGEGDSTDLIRTFLPPQDEPDPDEAQNRFVDPLGIAGQRHSGSGQR